MIKHVFLLTFGLVMLFLFSGCVQRELILDEQETTQTEENNWAEETNQEENIDISDLEDMSKETENEMVITEEISTEKMARIPFPSAEYAQLATRGKGTVKGSIFVKYGSSEHIFGKGTRLYLNPVTSYSEQWYNESYLDGNKMQKADSRLFNYLKFTASDNEGNFAFYGVPSGSYYLIGTVKCGTECGYDTPKNIRIATHVSIHGNQVLKKDLSRQLD